MRRVNPSTEKIGLWSAEFAISVRLPTPAFLQRYRTKLPVAGTGKCCFQATVCLTCWPFVEKRTMAHCIGVTAARTGFS